ncbi:MAG: LpqB family beta-propeller domain-containing protein [Sciscionella sp.]
MSVDMWPAMRRSTGLLCLVLAGCLLLTGCATIPTSSDAEAVPADSGRQSSAVVVPPETGADPFSIVQGFVQASADPASDHANARGYLTDSARKRWNPGESLTVVSEPINAVPAGDSGAPDQALVTLRVRRMGVLGPDAGFQPMSGELNRSFRLRRQIDGQWRIMNPPDGVIVPATDFLRFYHLYKVYYVDPTQDALVPDLRYLKPVRGRVRLATQVVDTLLSGPSSALSGAVRNMIPQTAVAGSTVSEAPDGSLVVNLSSLGEQNRAARKLIAKQVLRSLENVVSRPLRIEADGEPLLADHPKLYRGELPTPKSVIEPNPNSTGLVTVEGAVRELDDGVPVPGPAGTGAYKVISAAQSTDGQLLAMVSDVGSTATLRVGRYGADAQRIDIKGRRLTRPSWGPRNQARSDRSEVWTVADQRTVYRAVSNGDGPWTVQKIDAGSLTKRGKISKLRLSRDGVRVAAVVGGRLLVAPVQREPDSITIGKPALLGSDESSDVVGVDWGDQDVLIVATTSATAPVTRCQVDGLNKERYDPTSLTAPLSAVTAAPKHPVVVADREGMWNYLDSIDKWRPLDYEPGPNVIPFYPG